MKTTPDLSHRRPQLYCLTAGIAAIYECRSLDGEEKYLPLGRRFVKPHARPPSLTESVFRKEPSKTTSQYFARRRDPLDVTKPSLEK